MRFMQLPVAVWDVGDRVKYGDKLGTVISADRGNPRFGDVQWDGPNKEITVELVGDWSWVPMDNRWVHNSVLR